MEGKRDSFFLSNKKKADKANKGTFKKNKVEGTQENYKKEKRQDNFNKNRPGLEQNGEEKVKKPFDKKTYRLKKYSKKYKLDQWEEQRKKKLLHNYYKEIQNDPASGSYKPINFDEDQVDSNEVGKFVRHPDAINKVSSAENVATNGTKPVKKDPYSKAKEQFEKIKQQKIDKQKEIEKAKEEKKQKMHEYKKKKQERFKKLSKKTKKGQPVMTGRMELLLEKIQKSK
ncbi:thyroid transcription factor 1-associated protein 26 [Plutella xylostella]|uniref:thyroid transcription factor 1-associated protein 26 n=1 Tax=Plutella xylostella TaxID=51655 RepID=UPI0020331859|nr:thyroid transcription factor 1-associated protein 26 [Plutella xylostella]